MTKVILDPASEARLRILTEQAELCDQSGQPFGLFIPSAKSSLYAEIQVPFTEEELDQAEKEPGGYTLAEILAHLETLSCSKSDGAE